MLRDKFGLEIDSKGRLKSIDRYLKPTSYVWGFGVKVKRDFFVIINAIIECSLLKGLVYVVEQLFLMG